MSLEDTFVDRAGAHRPVPWWAWTGRLDAALLKEQLHLMYAQGIREFFIFPIYGMEWEYMGEEYLRGIEWVLEWCRELGMKAWIYDEHNWPSSTAGGRVPRYHPEAIAWVVDVLRHQGIGPAQAEQLCAEPSVLHACLVGADGIPEPVREGRVAGTSGLELVRYCLRRDATRNLTVRASLWCRGERGVVDMLSPEACQCFIQEAYSPIVERFPAACGTTLTGFFTDEPLFASWGSASVPWTTRLPEHFLQQCGYDLVARLHDLTFDTETAVQTRADYWSLIARLSAEAFTGQIAQWCEQRGLVLTGHLIDEESLRSVRAHGDTPTHLRRMQVPGCDLLELRNSYDSPCWPALKTPKIASSSARAAGRARVMCEAFGIAAWIRTMADEKRMTDWLVALGVNLINDNSLITDISAFRKRATSGKHFTQPWWTHARLLYEYAGRLSALSAATTLDTEVAVLYPTTSWWAITRVGQEPSPQEAGSLQLLDAAVEMLVQRHWHFEFLFEDLLAKATVQQGALVTAEGAFRAVIVAGAHYLPAAAATRLEQFAAAGGQVVAIGPVPKVVGGEECRQLCLDHVMHVPSVTDGMAGRELDKALGRVAHRTWRIEGKKADQVISAARVDEDGRALLFVSNQTPGDAELQVRWDGQWPVELWDATDERRWTPEQGPGVLRLTLPDEGSVWVVQTAAEPPDRQPPAWWLQSGAVGPAVWLDGPWQFRAEPANLFRLPCRLLPDPNGKLTLQDVNAADTKSWVEVEWGDAGIALAPETMHAYWLVSTFSLDEPIADLQLIGDSSDVTLACLNGEPLGPPTSITVWSHTNQAWSLADARPGENYLLLRVGTSPYYARDVAGDPIITTRLEPVALRGSFGVQQHERWSVRLGALPEAIRTGDWCTQGFPHFVGTGVYEQSFAWSLPGGPALFCCNTGRDVVEVLLDGVSLDVRAWGPRQFVAEQLAPGVHRLQVRVWNTLGAILRRGYHKSWVEVEEVVSDIPPTGLLSEVRIFALPPEASVVPRRGGRAV